MLLPTSFERGRLPPPHLRLIDHRYEKIETPVDERGVVKPFELAKSRARDIRKNPSILKPEYNGIDIDGMQWVEKELQSDFSGYERHLRGLETLPPEFRLIEMDEAETNFNFVAKKLGKLVGKRAINLVPHVIAA